MSAQWPLIIFTLLMCAASGVLGGTGVLVLRGKGQRLYFSAMVASAALICLGGLASFFHLHHWERIFNGFGNMTSGITLELIAIAVALVVLVVMFALLRQRKDDAGLPKWFGAVLLILGIGMVAVCAASYLMPARPAWSNASEVASFFASALVLGASILWALAAVKDKSLNGSLSIAVAACGCVMAVAVAAFAACALGAGFDVPMSFYDPVEPVNQRLVGSAAVADVILGSSAAIFWGGALVVGSLAPAACGLIGRKKPEAMTALAAIASACALVGGICFRYAFFLVGFTAFGLF